MIVLYGFGPLFELPDPSPFVMKSEVQLKMSGLPFRRARAAPPQAPKGKIPFIADGETMVGDSTFIRAHIERVHGVDLDAGLGAEQRARAWMVERMLEDHVYWALLHARWMDDANWAKGPSRFFNGAPEAVARGAREQVKANLLGHGLGRHTPDEIATLAARSLAALSAELGDKPYLMGDKPCGADATVFGMLAGILTPYFDTALRDAALAHPNLVAYRDRMMERYYPGFAQQAA
jgi:glutathione S-transferase